MGYANRLVRLDFPDLADEGDEIWVQIRNPKTLPLDQLTSKVTATDLDGVDKADPKVMAAVYDLVASVIVDWHVYDGSRDDEPLLELPATAEKVATLPTEIVLRVGGLIGDVIQTPQ